MATTTNDIIIGGDVRFNKLKKKNLTDFEIRFINLTTVVYLILQDRKDRGEIEETHFYYLFCKFNRYICADRDIDKFNLFCHSVITIDNEKGISYDNIINMYEAVYGVDSFDNISPKKNFLTGIHTNLSIAIDKFLLQFDSSSRKFKIWKILQEVEL